MAKLSLFLLYLRLFSVNRRTRHLIYFGIGTTVSLLFDFNTVSHHRVQSLERKKPSRGPWIRALCSGKAIRLCHDSLQCLVRLLLADHTNHNRLQGPDAYPEKDCRNLFVHVWILVSSTPQSDRWPFHHGLGRDGKVWG